MSAIKFINLQSQYPCIKEEILKKFDDIIAKAAFIDGKYIKEFEKQFAEFIGVKHCITASTGTDALHLAILGLDIGPQDEVIIPVNTFIATAEAISLTGATPVFIDCNEKTYNIDPTKIEDAITSKTKAIIPVHLYGQCADMDSILEIAQKHNLVVLEDACQAHGAEYKGRKAGSMGVAGAFSFYPGKNLGAWGEGGAITTNDDKLAEKMRLIRNHGSRKKYEHIVIGGNFRISELQGAVLSTKLKYLDKWNAERRKNAQDYISSLNTNNSIIIPYMTEHSMPVWHLFVIRTTDRDGLMDHLNNNNIQCGIHYPTSLHLTQAYKVLGYNKGDFPVAEKVQDEIISLPMYPELPEDDIQKVCQCINNFTQASSEK